MDGQLDRDGSDGAHGQIGLNLPDDIERLDKPFFRAKLCIPAWLCYNQDSAEPFESCYDVPGLSYKCTEISREHGRIAVISGTFKCSFVVRKASAPPPMSVCLIVPEQTKK